MTSSPDLNESQESNNSGSEQCKSHITSLLKDICILEDFQLFQPESNFVFWNEFVNNNKSQVLKLLDHTKDASEIYDKTKWTNSLIYSLSEFKDKLLLIENKIDTTQFNSTELNTLMTLLYFVSSYFTEKIQSRIILLSEYKSLEQILLNSKNTESAISIEIVKNIDLFIFENINTFLYKNQIPNLIKLLSEVKHLISFDNESPDTGYEDFKKQKVKKTRGHKAQRRPFHTPNNPIPPNKYSGFQIDRS